MGGVNGQWEIFGGLCANVQFVACEMYEMVRATRCSEGGVGVRMEILNAPNIAGSTGGGFIAYRIVAAYTRSRRETRGLPSPLRSWPHINFGEGGKGARFFRSYSHGFRLRPCIAERTISGACGYQRGRGMGGDLVSDLRNLRMPITRPDGSSEPFDLCSGRRATGLATGGLGTREVQA
jgi:hypothetical protein